MIRARTSTRPLVLSYPVLLLVSLSWIFTLIRPGSIPSINLAPVAGSTVASAAASRPNIITVMTDDQTVADMQVMPQVRSLIGAHGVTFTHSFVSYPMCCPSRATYFTGQYAHNHGVLYNNGSDGGYHALRHRDTIFPVALRRAGYDTIHIGKFLNGFGQKDLRPPPGWTKFYGAFDPTTYNYYGFKLDENGTLRTYPSSEWNYRTYVYERKAIQVIRHEAGVHHPFFLNVAMLAPHSNGPQEEAAGPQPAWVGRGLMDNRLAIPPLRYRTRFDRLSLPKPASFDEADMSDKPSFMQRGQFFRKFTPADMKDIADRYHRRLASLLPVDDAVAHIVRTLQQTHLLRRTVIIFTSDNGFFNGEHRIRAGKYFVYDPAVRVPLIIRGPGIAEGVTRSQYVANVDLAPTILALAHAKPLRTMDGRSLLPLLGDSGAQIVWNRALLLESGKNSDYPAIYHAIRTDRYLYVEYSTGDRELYDLANDPDELNNVAANPAYQQIKAQLAAHLKLLRSCKGASCQ